MKVESQSRGVDCLNAIDGIPVPQLSSARKHVHVPITVPFCRPHSPSTPTLLVVLHVFSLFSSLPGCSLLCLSPSSSICQSAPKTYVQHRVAARAADLRRLLLQQNAHVYVCGATSMGREVKEAVCQLLVAPGEAGACKDAAAALEYVKGMQTKKRYVQELWES